jgi:ABC-type multidrug transport system fused ATPase/permease subunit
MSWVKNNEWFVSPKDSRVQWQYVRRYLGYYRRFKASLILAMMLAVLGSGVAFFIPWIFNSLQHALMQGSLRPLAFLALGYLGILLLQSLVTYLMAGLKIRVSTQLNEDLLLLYYRKLLNISVEDFIEFKRHTNLFQRVIDAMAVTAEFTDIVIQGIQSAIVITVVMLAIATISPAVGLTVFAGAVALFLFVLGNGRKLQKLRQAVLAVNYPLVGQMLEAIEGLFTIKALAASVKVTSDIAKQVHQREYAERQQQDTIAAVSQGSNAIMAVTLVAALLVSFTSLTRHSLTYSDVFAVYVLANLLFAPLTDLARLCHNLPMVSINIKNYCQVLDLADEVALDSARQLPAGNEILGLQPSLAIAAVAAKEPRSFHESAHQTEKERSSAAVTVLPQSTNGTSPEATGHVLFRGIHFAYRGGEPVFKGLDLEILPGEKISLIGRSGVGKTTLLRLLMGFIRPQQGSIFIDGVDITHASNTDSVRQLFGMVSQQDFFFGTSLRENLVFGLRTAPLEEEIAEALALVGMRDTVHQLPNKLETIYSADIFSGGQKQRFFIARALLRRPRIVLLDEPTSALDFESEAQVIRALETLAGQNTTITVAHRLSTVRKANRVVVLKDGYVAGTGSHDELYAVNDYYRSFCQYNSFIL